MARVFITGSADGLGSLAAKQLVGEGHSVVLHARNEARADAARQLVPSAESVLVADLEKIDEVKSLAEQVNALGHFDVIIHNAAVDNSVRKQVFAVNSLAPFVLTALIDKPERMIYLSSSMHTGGRARIEDMETATSYSDSKFQIMLLTMAVARMWPSVLVNAVDPGWVATKMGGPSASDDLVSGYVTQVWLATSDDPQAKVTGKYFYHKRQASYARRG